MTRAILIFSLLLLWAAPLLAQEEYDPADYRIRVNATVNLRGGPGTEFEIVITIQAGAELQVVAETDEWFSVIHEGQQLWMANWLDYTRLEPTPTPEPSPTIEPTDTPEPSPTAEPTPTAEAQPTIQLPSPVDTTSFVPECTQDEFVAIVLSPEWQELFAQFGIYHDTYATGEALNALDYIWIRNTVWENLPTCSPLFEYAIWITFLYAENLAKNLQLRLLPSAETDPSVAALYAEGNSHPLALIERKLLEAWDRHFPPQENPDSAADDGAAEEAEEE